MMSNPPPSLARARARAVLMPLMHTSCWNSTGATQDLEVAAPLLRLCHSPHCHLTTRFASSRYHVRAVPSARRGEAASGVLSCISTQEPIETPT